MKSFLHRVLRRTFSNLKQLFRATNLDKKALQEILLRVDPDTIFDCILVNKEWLEVITDSEFRQSYNKRWNSIIKSPDKVIGFFKYGAGLPLQLLATTELGSTVNQTKLPAGLGQFIAKSSSGDGLILSGISPATFFVFDLTSGSVLARLPPPPVIFENPATAIVSSYNEDSCFTVIIAGTDDNDDEDHETISILGTKKDLGFPINIQTFSSSTEQWVQTTPDCSMYFKLSETGEPGLVNGNGLVYFRGTTVNGFGCVAVYDSTKSSDANKTVGLIFQPGLTQFSSVQDKNAYLAYYGICSRGYFRSATRKAYGKKDWDTGFISVYALEDDGIEWKLQHFVDPAKIWSKNSKLLLPMFKRIPRSRSFDFVSFAPGRSDCVYLRLQEEMFLYNLVTEKLELYGPKYYLPDAGLLPVTVGESGAWPSSPLSRQPVPAVNKEERLKLRHSFH